LSGLLIFLALFEWNNNREYNIRLYGIETNIQVDNERERHDAQRFVEAAEAQKKVIESVQAIADKLPTQFPPAVAQLQIDMNTAQIQEQSSRMGRLDGKLDENLAGQRQIMNKLNEQDD